MLQEITTRLLFLMGLSLLAHTAHGQQTWSLEDCIRYAQENNLTTKQAEYDVQNAELTEKLNQFSRLPGLSARTSAGYQFGRTIDPTTNTFNNERIGFNSFSVDANVPVYNGNRINNSIRQSQLDVQAAKLDAQATVNDISLNIASAYLSILLAEEQLDNARRRLELSQEQLSQTDKLIRAGSVPVNDRLDFLAQIALDEQAIIEAENQVAIGYLNLKQLMELDPGTEIKIFRPASISIPGDADPRALQLEEVYNAALQSQPQVKAADLRLESAEIEESIAGAGMLPSLNLFASMNTNYSSAARDFNNANFENAQFVPEPENQAVPVIIGGQETILREFELEGVVIPRKSYTDQINENFGQTVGLSLSVPIYSNHRNRIAQERARLGVLNTQVANRQLRQQLKADVQRSIADARAARESLRAAERSVEAAQAAFDNAEKRFQLGVINTLEYTTARNNLDRAQIDLIRAKYQYLFNLKTVDFYLGRPITLE